MKKFNFLCLFFVLFLTSFGQNNNSSQNFNEKLKYSRMGLYFSPCINFIHTNTHAETKSNLGIVYGYAIEMSLNKNHYIESGFSITYKGGDITQNVTITNIDKTGNTEQEVTTITSDYKVEYLTLPFLIKMRSREIGYFHYFAKIGPSINFKIKDMITSEDKARFLSVDLSIFLGAEYSLGGKTSIESSIFFTNNITNSIANNDMHALFHQLGLRLGFLF